MDSAALKPSKPSIGGRYVHIETQGEYRVDDILPIKLEGQWDTDGVVIYQAMATGHRYARPTRDFMQKFRYGFPDKQRPDPLTPDQYDQNLLHHGIVR
jgi:hypothetical protein